MIRAEPITEAGAKRRNYASTPDVGPIPGLWDDIEPAECAAPDGRPWLKCCDECAYRDKAILSPIEETCRKRNAAFYCVHRETVGGHYRVCAGYAARNRPGVAA